jgi:hypothetical protein
VTDREQLITATLLKQLKGMKGGGPVHESVLLNATSLLVPKLRKSEFDQALLHCDRSGWAISTPGILNTTKWALSDAGEVAVIELS